MSPVRLLKNRDTSTTIIGVTVILNVYLQGWRHAETAEEMTDLVSKVLDELVGTSGTAWFGISDRRHVDVRSGPENNLRVAVNGATGYGGLVWFVNGNGSRHGGIYDHVWVSDNPEPPDFDPGVVTDTHVAAYLDRRSVVPLAKVREVVEEFCRTGTGDRPEGISWVRSDANGIRR